MAHQLLLSVNRVERFILKSVLKGRVDHLQLWRRLSVLRNNSGISTIEYVQHQWRLFCQNPPKGFEKFFKPGGGKQTPKPTENAAKEVKENAASEKAPPKEAPPTSNIKKPSNQWPLGLFSPGNRSGTGNKSFDGDGKDKWMLIGALGFISVISLMLFSNYTYKEITWKEFVYRYLNNGLVEKLEVVNKKWVRVCLLRENDIEGTHKLWFNIGSTDTFERNMENAQLELNMEPQNHLPIIYKTEIDSSSMFGFLPMLVIAGVIIYVLRRTTDVLSGKGKRRGGLFGTVMESTAKLINSNEIGVRFKDVAGCEEAKIEIMEFVNFLKNPQQYIELGAKIPKGAMLTGPPGTGKTLLAKATAGEANVPFITVSGSEFLEMFVGVGPSRVRDMFAMARKNAPCILFIDEIDAVGRKRGGRNIGGHSEQENTFWIRLFYVLVDLIGKFLSQLRILKDVLLFSKCIYNL